MSAVLAIYGTGAHARKVYHVALASGWRVAVFMDDSPQATSPVAGVPCVDGTSVDPGGGLSAIFVAIGEPTVRRRITQRLRASSWQTPTLRHPLAWVSPDAVLGPGVLVTAMAVVETRATVGEGAIIDVGAIVDHDARVGAYAHLTPGQVLAAGAAIPSPMEEYRR